MFHFLFTQPLFNILVVFLNIFHDLGLSIIAITLLIRVILYPLFYKAAKNNLVMQKLQPLIKDVHEKHKDHPENKSLALLALYKEHQINPLSSLLIIIIQLPILIALYSVFQTGITPESLKDVYSFITAPAVFNSLFLNKIDLLLPNLPIIVLAGLFQFIFGVVSLPRNSNPKDPQYILAKRMLYFAPILTVVVLWRIPSALGLYWLTSSLVSLLQQLYINRKLYGSN